ncbi:MAG: DUF6688 family protein [Planctomycetota bacterium]
MRPLNVSARVLCVLGGLVIPVVCFVTVAFDPSSIGPRDRREGWHAFMLLLFHRDANVGFGLLLLASGVALCVAISDPERFAASRPVRALVALGVVVSASYVVFGALSELAFAFVPANGAAFVLCLVFSRVLEKRAAPVALLLVVLFAVAFLVVVASGIVLDEAFVFLLALAAGPAWSLIAYATLWRRLRRESPGSMRGPFLVCLAAYYAAFAYAFFQASRLYRELPEHRSDCYVATAAARGHRRLVGPWPSLQLVWLKRGELVLAQLAPRVHRRLRRVYDGVGPGFAARIRHPLAADLAYLSLKPAEWAVRVAFAATMSLRRDT